VSGSCFEHPCSQLPLKTATGKTPNRLPLIRLSIFVVSTLLMAVIENVKLKKLKTQAFNAMIQFLE